jgi:hypothetical protein
MQKQFSYYIDVGFRLGWKQQVTKQWAIDNKQLARET